MVLLQMIVGMPSTITEKRGIASNGVTGYDAVREKGACS
jgi:hypothetical protein